MALLYAIASAAVVNRSMLSSDAHGARIGRKEQASMSSDARAHDGEPLVLVGHEDGVTWLTLNRGDRFNPLSSQMIAAVEAALEAAAVDPAARAIVLAANGRGFCAGHDLKEMRAHAGDKGWQRRLFDDCSRMMTRLTRMPQPVIARVHGIATAAGCQLVSMCDLAVASENASFALPGVNIGIFCSTPAVGVARNVGRKRAMEMLLTGQLFDAKTALAWGLVNRVVPTAELDTAIRGYTDVILSRSAATIRMGKAAFYAQIERPLAEAYDVASETMACNMLIDDAAEGIDAFLEKRPAVWSSR
jgi:enoyl-CoA hydratase/carnithine racemase